MRAPEERTKSTKNVAGEMVKMAGSSFSADFSEFLFKRHAWYKLNAPARREMVARKRIPQTFVTFSTIDFCRWPTQFSVLFLNLYLVDYFCLVLERYSYSWYTYMMYRLNLFLQIIFPYNVLGEVPVLLYQIEAELEDKGGQDQCVDSVVWGMINNILMLN